MLKVSETKNFEVFEKWSVYILTKMLKIYKQKVITSLKNWKRNMLSPTKEIKLELSVCSQVLGISKSK